jgi:hypothetical protein
MAPIPDTTWLADFAAEILVRCPQCARCARLRPLSGPYKSTAGFRCTCAGCGAVKEWTRDARGGLRHPGAGPEVGGFGLQLWLQTPCCGECLWAWNDAHLTFLETRIAAKLRRRRRDPVTGWANASLASRLPAWMLKASHRAPVLAGLRRLREMLP